MSKDFQILNLPPPSEPSHSKWYPEWLSDNAIIDRYHRIKSAIVWFFQRLTRGWDDRELWSLDCTLAKHALPRLRRFRATLHGHPGEITHEEWESILDKMIWSMDYIAGDRQWGHNDQWQEDEKRCDEGIALFGKYFRGLWN
jgi:hypothetical protein